ncbi:MAG TPA: ribonuclease R [Longimicrobiales bacterium]|nr:ribonuclease R [Longimicrobiales bacterium]
MDPRRIVEFLRTEAGRPLKARELARALRVPEADHGAFREQLDRLEREGVLYRVQRQRYAAPERINLQVGRIQTTRSGAGFLIPDEGGPDVFIPVQALNTALDGDRAVVRVESKVRTDRPQGTVIRVLERSRSSVVGVFHRAQPGRSGRASHGFVVPEDRKLPWDVFVAPGGRGDASDGDVVVVRITDWGSEHRGPSGEVSEVLGRLGDAGVDVLAILHGHELAVGFPAEAEAAAEAARDRGVTEADLDGREDLRELLVFTIDPADARDHDDALSIEPLPRGGWRVGVHIADVSHYVRPDSPLDAEALRRGTSVYLVDRVVPMLPHALSSDLCSLVPDTDRLTLSLFVDMAPDGGIRGHQFARSVIRSRQRISYEEAQAVLDGTGSVADDADAAIRELHEVALRLRQARVERGSLDFDLPETRVVLDVSGQPVDIQKVVRLDAHRLVEDFMLLANEVVARKASQAEVPFVYRIHEPPDESRMVQLREFVATFGHRLPGRAGRPMPRDLQRLIRAAEGRTEEGLVSTVVLRSMKQARYSAENVGHFGLATTHYAHFTSPIRRYPDLVVHRLLAARFLDESRDSPTEEYLQDVARHSSERERVAVAAERDSKDLKRVEFMSRHVGDEFEGTISGVTAFGFFVLLDDFFVEGLVHVSSLEDDYYLFVEEQYALIGERTRRRFRTGDRVAIRVARANIEERKIDFDLVDGGTRRPADGHD